MNYILQWNQISFLYWLIPTVLIIAWLRGKIYKPTRYRFTLVKELTQKGFQSKHLSNKLFFLIRLLTLLAIALLVAQPRLVDSDSKVPVEGIHIVLVLDASGSMHNQDEQNDPRTRLDVAKEEAIRFIEKRDNDAIGLVLFANDALSRVPLTMDKQLLKSVIDDIQIGFINHNGTLLFTGVITAANRLKHSKAVSKIIILLTDGQPTDGDMSPQVALEIVKQLGIKVYAIGIGSEESRYIQDPFNLLPGYFAHGAPRGVVPGVNKEILSFIANNTGGQFFLAKNPKDMRAIYDTIDKLETTQQEIPLFSRWYDIAFFAIWFILALLIIEFGVSTFVWFSI